MKNILARVFRINHGFAISFSAHLEREKGSFFESSYIGVIEWQIGEIYSFTENIGII